MGLEVEVEVEVEVAGPAAESDLVALVNHVDVIAEIPNSLRQGTPVTLDRIKPDQDGQGSQRVNGACAT